MEILAITETKKKSNGIVEIGKELIMIYSGAKTDKRAAARVGCIIGKECKKSILEFRI